MTPELRRTGAISAALHGALLLALLLTLKAPPAPPLGDSAITMEFSIEQAQVQRAQTPSPTPAPAPAVVPTPDQPSLVKPLPTPVEAPPPPPPPPPPSPPAPTAAPVPAPPIPLPPIPPPALQAPISPVPAPLQSFQAPLPVPPAPPPPAPAPPRPVPQAAPPAPKPIPAPPSPKPAPERPNPAPRPTTSNTNQPSPTKNTADDSQTIEATLERLRSRQPQLQPPTHVYNPPRGGAIGGGAVNGVDNARLSASARGAIGDMIRECWTRDAGARDADKQVVRLVVTTDASGTIRIADISPNDASRSGGGVARAFAERARRAALDPQCARLPLPAPMMGQNHTFEITFKP